MNKIISRLVHERILNVLPRIISQNKAGFLKVRNITQNVLLSQEIVKNVQMRSKMSMLLLS